MIERATDRFFDIHGLPDWLDKALLQRASKIRDQHELESLVARFADCEQARAQLLPVLLTHLTVKAEVWIVLLLAKFLVTTSTWKKYGPPIITALIRQGMHGGLWWLVFGVHDPRLSTEDLEQKLRPLVPTIHLAFAQGILQFTEAPDQRLDPEATRRALTAIGVLDPPRHFTNDIRFKTRCSDADTAATAKLIHRIASAAGGSDADLTGVLQCIQELKALIAVQQS